MASSNNGTGGTTTAQQQQQQQAAGQEEASPPLWWAAFPEPKASCHRLEAADVMQLLESHASLGTHSDRSFLLVDVRRTDWEGGTVATSINLPAQTLYQTRPVIYQLCKQAGVKTIIFYCGSSSGRGPRCAGWMQDYLNEVGEASVTAAVLKGGIKGWQKTYGGRMMDAYDPKFWSSNQGSC
ncbi:arsenate reductase [Purpureocillium lilacinum]|uniref:Arsenate reductase n=1 Tax=Purpureocillium lilacinum TaxID=33203 RepID=A0A179GNN4_PURLI|nr:arsenate reductase [Purpureocillium lilacinum]OAQ79382.1 arsenate reductase [Purpureocillium lilacinum]